MTIRVMDGFELYDGAVTDDIVANLSDYWTGSPSTDEWKLQAGRYSGFAIEPIYTSGEQIYQSFTALTDGEDLHVFFNFKISSSGVATDILVFPFHTDGTGIKILGDGTIGFIMEETDMSSTNYVASTTVSLNTWYTFQGTFTRHATVAQDQKFWINGTLSQGSSTCANISRFGIDTGQQSAEVYIDDLVVVEDDSNEFSDLPDQETRIIPTSPVSDGTREEWNLSAGSDSFSLVDDVVSDDDVTYIESATVNQRTTFNMTTIVPPTGLEVTAVKVMDRSRNTTGVTQLTRVLAAYDGASDYEIGSGVIPGTSYGNVVNTFNINPTDSSAWTTSDFNNMEIGVKSKSGPV